MDKAADIAGAISAKIRRELTQARFRHPDPETIKARLLADRRCVEIGSTFFGEGEFCMYLCTRLGITQEEAYAAWKDVVRCIGEIPDLLPGFHAHHDNGAFEIQIID